MIDDFNGTRVAGHNPLDDIIEEKVLGYYEENRGRETGSGNSESIFKYKPQVKSIDELIVEHPYQEEPVVDGLFRRSDVVNIIASPKCGKSWLALGLAYSVVNGTSWLGFKTTQGKVLIVDNELKASTIASRAKTVSRAMDVEPTGIDVESLRGRLVDIHGLLNLFESIESKDYAVVILDAFYKFLPKGMSENDNAEMAQVYNVLDNYAERTGSVIVLIHHTSKGDQSGKSSTDVGAGAGVISRAADCHIVMREHALEGCIVLDANVRTFPPVASLTLKREFPVWTATAIEAELKPRKSTSQQNSEKEDSRLIERIVERLSDGEMTSYEIRKHVGTGQVRADKLIRKAEDAGLVGRRTKKIETKKKVAGRKRQTKTIKEVTMIYAKNPDSCID